MRWRKLGKIFDPTACRLPIGYGEFAQSPQAVVFDDFVRVYCSTRERDGPDTFVSHISYIDFDKAFTRIIGVAERPVIELGQLGCFDEHGIFPMSPLPHGDKIIAYTCGWSRRMSVPVETSTGYAVSVDNGRTFRKIGPGPIMSSSLHEPFLVGDSFVRVIDDIFHMWYIFGVRWTSQPDEPPARVYKIAYARSEDGLSWNREGRQIISDELNADECQALPTVIDHAGLYHMFFCYREATRFRNDPKRGYRIGYATSSDMRNWTRKLDPGITVSSDGWDSEMICYPHAFRCDDKIYLLYNGNQFGRFGFGLAVWED